jgi:hypothetical protein
METDALKAILSQEVVANLSLDLSAPEAVLQLGGEPLVLLEPPSVDDLGRGLPHVQAAMDLRADRLPEIVAQSEDILPFFGVIIDLHPERTPWTGLLLEAAHRAIVAIEMRVKLHACLPRPIAFAPHVSPILETPAHSTWPSGHATESFAIATLLTTLRLQGAGATDPAVELLAGLSTSSATAMDPTSERLFRMAHRIADNRTVAGLHFPVDSAHGALLGTALGLALTATLSGRTDPLPCWSVRGSDWVGDFSLANWQKMLVERQAPDGPDVPRPGAGTALPEVWGKAVAEWS